MLGISSGGAEGPALDSSSSSMASETSSTAGYSSTFFFLALTEPMEKRPSFGIAAVKDTCRSNQAIQRLLSALDGYVCKCMPRLAGRKMRVLLRLLWSNGGLASDC